MDTTQIAGIVAVPTIVGLVQVGKTAGLSSNWAALSALIIGVILALGAFLSGQTGVGTDLYQAVLSGIALGLAASGLYSAGYAVTREPSAVSTLETAGK